MHIFGFFDRRPLTERMAEEIQQEAERYRARCRELHQEFWGRGLATEGGQAGVRYGFEVVGLERIISATMATNACDAPTDATGKPEGQGGHPSSLSPLA